MAILTKYKVFLMSVLLQIGRNYTKRLKRLGDMIKRKNVCLSYSCSRSLAEYTTIQICAFNKISTIINIIGVEIENQIVKKFRGARTRKLIGEWFREKVRIKIESHAGVLGLLMRLDSQQIISAVYLPPRNKILFHWIEHDIEPTHV
ncbi:unnamed protein product [Rhizophagus irregularis]|nr:unnamed protein product [Rhizophagus irregularis]CAB5390579.1 unnamed protein product [Rhizophagus irregularis]